MDKGFKNGVQSYNLVTIITSDENSKISFAPTYLESNVSMPFKSFAGCNIILTNKKKSNQLVLLILSSDGQTKKTNSSSVTGVSTYSWEISLGKEGDKKNTINIINEKSANLSEESLDLSSLENRLKFDAEANIYWVLDSDINTKSSQYGLINVITHQKLFPNTKEGRAVKFLSDTERHAYFSEGMEEAYNYRGL